MPYRDDTLGEFAARLVENLDGRRLLDRSFTGVESEPATLSQLAALTRVTTAIAALEPRNPTLARAADAFLTELMHVLVARAARGDIQVARWPQAEHTLTLLADLLDASASSAASTR